MVWRDKYRFTTKFTVLNSVKVDENGKNVIIICKGTPTIIYKYLVSKGINEGIFMFFAAERKTQLVWK